MYESELDAMLHEFVDGLWSRKLFESYLCIQEESDSTDGSFNSSPKAATAFTGTPILTLASEAVKMTAN